MLPKDIINNLISQRGYTIAAKYSEYTVSENTIMLVNGANRITFRCKYATIEEMEKDMKEV